MSRPKKKKKYVNFDFEFDKAAVTGIYTYGSVNTQHKLLQLLGQLILVWSRSDANRYKQLRLETGQYQVVTVDRNSFNLYLYLVHNPCLSRL